MSVTWRRVDSLLVCAWVNSGSEKLCGSFLLLFSANSSAMVIERLSSLSQCSLPGLAAARPSTMYSAFFLLYSKPYSGLPFCSPQPDQRFLLVYSLAVTPWPGRLLVASSISETHEEFLHFFDKSTQGITPFQGCLLYVQLTTDRIGEAVLAVPLPTVNTVDAIIYFFPAAARPTNVHFQIAVLIVSEWKFISKYYGKIRKR